MTQIILGVLGTVVLSLAINETSDLAPWLARKLVLRAAMWWTADPDRSTELAQEWAAVIDDAPGKLTKLGHALLFAGGAVRRRGAQRLASWSNRALFRRFVKLQHPVIQKIRSWLFPAPARDLGAQLSLSGGGIKIVADGMYSEFVKRYLAADGYGPAAFLMVGTDGRFHGIAFPHVTISTEDVPVVEADVILYDPGNPNMVELEQLVRENRSGWRSKQ